MRKTTKDLWIIASKDLIEFSRDRLRLFSFFIMPFFMMIMVGFIFPSGNSVKNLQIGIADLDNGDYGRQLVKIFNELKNDEGERIFKLKAYKTVDDLKEGIKAHQVYGGIYIPESFSKQIDSNRGAEITILEDQANPQASHIFTQAISRVLSEYSKQISIQKISVLTGSPVDEVSNLVQPVREKITGIIPGKHSYFQFVAPGIIAMIVMTAVLTGLAASISREKEIGTMDGILISPINRLSIVLGKALAQSVRGIIQGALVLVLAMIVFGVKIYGSLLLILLILILGIFSFVGFGILVSAAAAEQETATQLLFMFQFPMLFFSGVFFPISMMPEFMQKISKVIPLTYAVEALRKVMILGGDINSVKIELIVMLTFGVITTSFAVPIFKKMITR